MQAEDKLQESRVDDFADDAAAALPDAPMGDSVGPSPGESAGASPRASAADFAEKPAIEKLVPFKDSDRDNGWVGEDSEAVLASIKQHLADQEGLIGDLCERASKVTQLQSRLAALEKRAEVVADGVDSFRKELRAFLGMPCGSEAALDNTDK